MSQPIVLSEAEITALLPKVNIVAVLERMFRSLAAGNAVQPPQTLSLFPKAAGDFITYLGVLADRSKPRSRPRTEIPSPLSLSRSGRAARVP